MSSARDIILRKITWRRVGVSDPETFFKKFESDQIRNSNFFKLGESILVTQTQFESVYCYCTTRDTVE